MAHQSLYRRYRPSRFADLVGQQHVVEGLRNAVRDDRSGHAYLFSGPRGTGKTSTARILARALNCTDLQEGEPCGGCDSCQSIQAGTSYDLFELDAASNNKVEDIRDLISRVAIGSPGRTKVYILDEVHMLSAAASNALLKTLEEPPPHVTFVLATTDPQKVLPTIRSRTQHFEFGLVPATELEAHLRWVVGDAELNVDDEALAWVLRKGAGSVRDALSALDQVAAIGGVGLGAAPLDELLEALCERDSGRALVGLATALASGREPRLVAEELLGRLRDAFLAAVAPDLSQLADLEATRVADVARRLGTAGVTRSLEAVGAAVLEMRQAPDARVPLEIALIRLTRPELDTSVAALVERVARLEAALASGIALPGGAAGSPLPAAGPGAASSRSAADDDPANPVAPSDGARNAAPTSGPSTSGPSTSVTSTSGTSMSPAPSAPSSTSPSSTPGLPVSGADQERSVPRPAARQTPPGEVREGAAAAARRQLAARAGSAGPPPRTGSSPAAGTPRRPGGEGPAAPGKRQDAGSTPNGAERADEDPAAVARHVESSERPDNTDNTGGRALAESAGPTGAEASEAAGLSSAGATRSNPATTGVSGTGAVVADETERGLSTTGADRTPGSGVGVAGGQTDSSSAVGERNLRLLPGGDNGADPSAAAVPSVEELGRAWTSGILDELPAGVRALFRAGQFIGVQQGAALFALPSAIHRDRCAAKVAGVERGLARHFGYPVPLRLVVDEARTAADRGGFAAAEQPGSEQLDAERYAADAQTYAELADVSELPDAPNNAVTGLDLLQQTFPGAEILE